MTSKEVWAQILEGLARLVSSTAASLEQWRGWSGSGGVVSVGLARGRN